MTKMKKKIFAFCCCFGFRLRKTFGVVFLTFLYMYIYIYIYIMYIYVDSSVRRLDNSKLENQIIVSTHTYIYQNQIKDFAQECCLWCVRVSLLKTEILKNVSLSLSLFSSPNFLPPTAAHLMFPLFLLFCSSCFVNQLTFEKITNTMLRLDRCCVLVGVCVSVCVFVCVSVCVCVCVSEK